MLICIIVYFLVIISIMVTITEVFAKTSLSTIKLFVYTHNLFFFLTTFSFYLAKTLSWLPDKGDIRNKYGKWLVQAVSAFFEVELECKIIFAVLLMIIAPVFMTKLILGIRGYGRMPSVILRSSITAIMYTLKSYIVMCAVASSLIFSFYFLNIPHGENLFSFRFFIGVVFTTTISLIFAALIPAANSKFHKISVERSPSYLAAIYFIDLICALDDKLMENEPPKIYIVNINRNYNMNLIKKLFDK